MAALFRIGHGVNFCVRSSGAKMKAFANDFAPADQHSAHARIRKRQARAKLRKFQRMAEETGVRHSATVAALYDRRTLFVPRLLPARFARPGNK